jgi:hypothetical protein
MTAHSLRVIDEFRNENAFLSNFYDAPVSYRNAGGAFINIHTRIENERLQSRFDELRRASVQLELADAGLKRANARLEQADTELKSSCDMLSQSNDRLIAADAELKKQAQRLLKVCQP